MARVKKLPPPAGGSIEHPIDGVASDNSGINPQVMKMTGHQSEEEMAASLPTDTIAAQPEEDRPKRKRRSKEEIAASRGEVNPTADPLLADPRYMKAISHASAFGAGKSIKGGFKIAGKIAHKPEIALDREEEEEVDLFFYAMSKRRALADPFATWWGSLLYFTVMMATLIGSRFAMMQGDHFQKQLAKAFGFGEKEETVVEAKE